MNALNVLFNHWIVKFEFPHVLATDYVNKYINSDHTHFCRVYNVQFKPLTPYATMSNRLVVNSSRQLKPLLQTVLK